MFKRLLESIRNTILTSLTCLLYCITPEVYATAVPPLDQIKGVYFFGDSLTDGGFNNNLAAFPFVFPVPYPAGKAPTFTTYGGYTWAQLIAHDLIGYPLPPLPYSGSDDITNNMTPTNPPNFVTVIPTLTGVNYASGGSTTDSTGFSLIWAPSLVAQIQQFLSDQGNVLSADDVYFIWAGSNDLLAAAQVNAPIPAGCPPQPLDKALACKLKTKAGQVAKTIATQVHILKQHGAKRVVVLKLPNLSSTPYMGLEIVPLYPTLDPAALKAGVKNLVFFFNAELNKQLGLVDQSFGTNTMYLDTYTFLDEVIQKANAKQGFIIDGQAFYFDNPTDEACNSTPETLTQSALFCPPSSQTKQGFVFADGLHPSYEAHTALAAYVKKALKCSLNGIPQERCPFFD
jgi:outer membrane lipase/esterase